ncbi:mechanosensitive ion channel [Alcaligenaceae bacterium SJ-26]|nr:mechanosensitive ion channel [Alcaligenaceae bacterium SJ-26]
MSDTLNVLQSAMPTVEAFALNLLVALIILVVGWSLSDFAGRWVHRLTSKSSRIDQTIVPILRSITVWTVRIFVLIAVLARFGVQTASIIAVLGAAGLAIGLALQGTLQNIAAGFMLLALRPIRAGEFVSIAGHGDGTVDEVGLFMTRLIQIDGIHVVLPNSLVWGSPIINYSRNETRRLDLQVGVRYGDDLDLAIGKLTELVNGHELVLKDPAPQVMAFDYRENAIIINIRVWAKADRYWDLRFDLYRTATQALHEAGLKLPIPVREIKTIEKS